MRIGIYGGSFNPIHIGHLHVADSAMHKYFLDSVIFVPAWDPYMKPKEEMASAWCRLEMTAIAVQNIENFLVDCIEFTKSGPSYTVDTLEYFKRLYPTDDLFLIVGQDAYEQIPTWKNPDKIKELAKVAVVDRDINISSTMIREKLRKGEPCKYLMPNGIYEYILEHNLYKDWDTLERMSKGV